MSLCFHIKCQEGEKLYFTSKVHLFSWPFPIISINSLSPLGIQKSISLACFQSEILGNVQGRGKKKPSLLIQHGSEMLIAFQLSNTVKPSHSLSIPKAVEPTEALARNPWLCYGWTTTKIHK